MSEFKKLLGKRIAQLRKEKNLTQLQFSEMVDLSPSSLAEIETGTTFPRAETIERIRNQLNCEYHELFNFHNDTSTETAYKNICTSVDYLYKHHKQKLLILNEFIKLLKR